MFVFVLTTWDELPDGSKDGFGVMVFRTMNAVNKHTSKYTYGNPHFMWEISQEEVRE